MEVDTCAAGGGRLGTCDSEEAREAQAHGGWQLQVAHVAAAALLLSLARAALACSPARATVDPLDQPPALAPTVIRVLHAPSAPHPRQKLLNHRPNPAPANATASSLVIPPSATLASRCRRSNVSFPYTGSIPLTISSDLGRDGGSTFSQRRTLCFDSAGTALHLSLARIANPHF